MNVKDLFENLMSIDNNVEEELIKKLENHPNKASIIYIIYNGGLDKFFENPSYEELNQQIGRYL